MDQHSRMAVLHEYKAGKHHVLVATDVAARGLDIKSVVNYDAAKEVDTHVHRIGRTGRAGDKEGIAYTLTTPYETRFAGTHHKLAMSWQFEGIPGALLTAESSAGVCQVVYMTGSMSCKSCLGHAFASELACDSSLEICLRQMCT